MKTVKMWLRKALRRLAPPAVAYLGQGIIHLIMLTCRLRVRGAENLHTNARRGGFIIMLWHNRMAIVTNVLLRHARQYRYAAVISNSRDGELLQACADTYRHGTTIRVPHYARHRAVKEIIRHLKAGTIIMMTPDGPRGPRYSVKPGIAFAAKAAQTTIVPFTWSASRYWQLPSWDKMVIPKPFSKVVVTIGEEVDVTDDDRDVKEISSSLQTTMKHLDNDTCAAITDGKTRWPQ